MEQFKVKKKHLVGAIAGFPKHIVQRMVDEQVLQGNKADPSAFAGRASIDKNYGGFNWRDTELKRELWAKVINGRQFDLIPKPEKPKGKPKAGTSATPNEIIKAMLDKGMTVWAAISDESYAEARERIDKRVHRIVEVDDSAFLIRTPSSGWVFAVPVDADTMTEITELP